MTTATLARRTRWLPQQHPRILLLPAMAIGVPYTQAAGVIPMAQALPAKGAAL